MISKKRKTILDNLEFTLLNNPKPNNLILNHNSMTNTINDYTYYITWKKEYRKQYTKRLGEHISVFYVFDAYIIHKDYIIAEYRKCSTIFPLNQTKAKAVSFINNIIKYKLNNK